jgi:HSP20 family protein
MTLVRSSLFAPMDKDLLGMVDRMERFLAESKWPVLRDSFAWKPTADAYKEGDTLVLRIEVPGIDPDKDIEISLTENMLHIKGQKSGDKELSEEDRYMSERYFGMFTRDFVIPKGVNPEAVTAQYVEGVLVIRVPIPTEEKPETTMIPVSAPAAD